MAAETVSPFEPRGEIVVECSTKSLETQGCGRARTVTLALGIVDHPGFFMTYAVVQAAVLLLAIRFVDLYEREPLPVVALMALWGATGAAIIAALGNEAVLGLLPAREELVFGDAISPPVVEELAKGIALVAAFLISQWASKRFGSLEFEGVTDGIVYGAAIGIGFAFTEDFFLFAERARETGLEEAMSVFVDRRDFLGPGILHHPLFTAAFGAGLGLATLFWNRGWPARVGFPLVGLAIAVAMHMVNNGFVELRLVLRYGLDRTAEWIGAGRPEGPLAETASDTLIYLRIMDWLYVGAFFAVIWLWLHQQQRVIRYELAEEVRRGVIEREDWQSLPRYWARSARYWRLLREGRLDEWIRLRRLHNELVDLAFLKWRLRRFGGDANRVEKCRRRIALLQAPGTT